MPTEKDETLVWFGEEIDPQLIECPPPAPGFTGAQVTKALNQVDIIMAELTQDQKNKLLQELRERELRDLIDFFRIHRITRH